MKVEGLKICIFELFISRCEKNHEDITIRTNLDLIKKARKFFFYQLKKINKKL